jgi:serine/threonine protein kinase
MPTIDPNPNVQVEKIRIFSFTGKEILEDDELSIIENGSYIFASLGMKLHLTMNFTIGEPYDGRACLGAFHKIRLLGSGTQGKVYLAFNKITKEKVVMKFIKL